MTCIFGFLLPSQLFPIILRNVEESYVSQEDGAYCMGHLKCIELQETVQFEEETADIFAHWTGTTGQSAREVSPLYKHS